MTENSCNREVPVCVCCTEVFVYSFIVHYFNKEKFALHKYSVWLLQSPEELESK